MPRIRRVNRPHERKLHHQPHVHRPAPRPRRVKMRQHAPPRILQPRASRPHRVQLHETHRNPIRHPSRQLIRHVELVVGRRHRSLELFRSLRPIIDVLLQRKPARLERFIFVNVDFERILRPRRRPHRPGGRQQRQDISHPRLPAHPLPQRSNMRHMMPPVPIVERQRPVQPHRSHLRMHETPPPLRLRHPPHQRHPPPVQRLHQN